MGNFSLGVICISYAIISNPIVTGILAYSYCIISEAYTICFNQFAIYYFYLLFLIAAFQSPLHRAP